MNLRRSLQYSLRDLAMVRITVRLALGQSSGDFGIRVGLGLGLCQKFANYACAISKVCSALCNSPRLTNRVQPRVSLKCGSAELLKCGSDHH